MLVVENLPEVRPEPIHGMVMLSPLTAWEYKIFIALVFPLSFHLYTEQSTVTLTAFITSSDNNTANMMTLCFLCM